MVDLGSFGFGLPASKFHVVPQWERTPYIKKDGKMVDRENEPLEEPEKTEDLEVVRAMGLNPAPEILSHIYASISVAFALTLMVWLCFGLFTCLTLDSAETQFPNDVYKDHIKEYYRQIYRAIITLIVVFGSIITVFSVLTVNSTSKKPTSPVTLLTWSLHFYAFCTLAITPITIWMSITNQPIPNLMNIAFYGFYLTTLSMIGIRYSFVRLIKLATEYNLKHAEENHGLQAVAVGSTDSVAPVIMMDHTFD